MKTFLLAVLSLFGLSGFISTRSKSSEELAKKMDVKYKSFDEVSAGPQDWQGPK